MRQRPDRSSRRAHLDVRFRTVPATAEIQCTARRAKWTYTRSISPRWRTIPRSDNVEGGVHRSINWSALSPEHVRPDRVAEGVEPSERSNPVLPEPRPASPAHSGGLLESICPDVVKRSGERHYQDCGGSGTISWFDNGGEVMREGRTRRVCPSCGATSASERVTCDYCGTLTATRSSGGHGNEGHRQGSSSFAADPGPGVRVFTSPVRAD
jgi:hypothetical protein